MCEFPVTNNNDIALKRPDLPLWPGCEGENDEDSVSHSLVSNLVPEGLGIPMGKRGRVPADRELGRALGDHLQVPGGRGRGCKTVKTTTMYMSLTG